MTRLPGPAVALLAGVLLLGPWACEDGSGGDPRAAGLSGEGAPDSVPAWCRRLPRPGNDTLELAFTSRDGWFRVFRLRPGVHAVYEPHQFQEVVSYVVEGRERAALIDTGVGISRLRPVVERITELPLVVLNTHSHPDHVGSNHAFERVLAIDAEITRERAARGFGHERVAGQVAPDALCRPLPPGTTADAYRIPPWEIRDTVTDGATVALGGRRLEVIRVPGHTDDALAILDRAHGLLFTGDTFYEGPIYLFSPETDLEAYAASVERLAALAPELELLLPGHNTAASSPSFLPALADAVRRVRTGRSVGRARDGHTEYVFQGFTLLLPGAGRSGRGAEAP